MIAPPQSYFEVVEKYQYAGDYFDFLRLYFTHFKGFCPQGPCMILPTWNHLWFLPYLWVYTMIAFVIIASLPIVFVFVARLLLFDFALFKTCEYC